MYSTSLNYTRAVHLYTDDGRNRLLRRVLGSRDIFQISFLANNLGSLVVFWKDLLVQVLGIFKKCKKINKRTWKSKKKKQGI